jgi:hypothetical protein
MLWKVVIRVALQQEMTSMYAEGDAVRVPRISASEDAFFSMLLQEDHYRDKDIVWSVWQYIGGLSLQDNITYGEKVDIAVWTTLLVYRLEHLCKDYQGKYTPL